MQYKNLLLNSRAASVALALAATTIFTTGCANLATSATDGGLTGGETAVVSGHLHGGNQPVSGATVQMFTISANGYGTAGLLLATTTSANDGAGSWSFSTGGTGVYPNTTSSSYACPATGDPYVYVIAKGGNTQGTGSSNNAASVFVAPLGTCKEIGTAAPFTDLTEVTTVATMAALQQYYGPSGSSCAAPTGNVNCITVADVFGGGSSGTASNAIRNAVSLVSYLVNLATGTAVSSKAVNFSYGARFDTGTVAVVETPDINKINTIANILAQCVNAATSGASSCQTLFNSAPPPTYSATILSPNGPSLPSVATDVVQAVYYMLANPSNGSTTNLSNLYTLMPAAGAPFQPTLGAAPSDWTIAITYTASGQCSTSSGNSGVFISSPTSITTDAAGDVWFANASNGNLSAIGAPTTIKTAGGPLFCAPTVAPPTGGATALSATVIDSSGNVWGTTNGTTSPGIVRYADPSLTSNATLTFPTVEAPVALTADGNGNVYYAGASGKLYILAGAATASAAVADVQIATGLGATSSLVVDNSVPITSAPSAPVIWATTGSSSILRIAGVSPYGATNFTTTPFSTGTPTYGVAVNTLSGASNNNVVFSLQGTANTIGNLFGSGTSYSSPASWPPAAGTGGLNLPTGIALDSRNNVWVANFTNSSSGGSVSELSATATATSPATGYQKAATSFNSSQAVAIDISGNVWVGGSSNSFITEIVGAAPPVLQPFATILKGDSALFQTAP